jgi:GntR family transcriptional regulator, transcriptional repressor for pyruvate dehydrogenase complex
MLVQASSEDKGGSAVSRAAERLRRLSMAKQDGEFLGSEDDLIAILEVSRPTLRQASAQVVQENLVAVRRGVGGGYFACVPQAMTVTRMAALFLQSRKVGLYEVLEAHRPLRMEIASLAARNMRKTASTALIDFVASEEAEIAQETEQTFRAFLSSEREFGRLMGDIAGNHVLDLFLSIVYGLASFTGRSEDVWFDHPDRVQVYRRHRLQMARAIVEGDEEIAKVASRRCSDLIVSWIQEDSPGAAP